MKKTSFTNKCAVVPLLDARAFIVFRGSLTQHLLDAGIHSLQ